MTGHAAAIDTFTATTAGSSVGDLVASRNSQPNWRGPGDTDTGGTILDCSDISWS